MKWITCIQVIIALFLATDVSAVLRTVKPVGGDFATFQSGVNACGPGDTLLVSPSIWNENVTISVDGDANNWINILAATNEGSVTVRKISWSGANYVRFIGFEMTHDGSTDYGQAMTFAGVCTHIEVEDVYIHHTRWEAFQMLAGSSPSYITIRGVRADYLGYPADTSYNFLSPNRLTPHHILVEYCTATRFADFVNFNGTNNVARNNVAYWIDSSLWAAIPHPDIWQPGSDGIVVGSRHHVYERHWVGQSTNEHSHFGLWKDNMNAGDTNMLIRGNIGHHFGGGGVGNEGFDAVRVYNNTLFKMCMNDNGASLLTARVTGAETAAAGGILKNNILADDGVSSSGGAINIEATNPYDATHNWGYDAGSESWLGTAYPQFVSTNIATLDLRLQSSSPARGVGTNVVWATTNTTAATFHVNDPQRLLDGWGIVEGDVVVIGNTTTRITLCDWTNNTITVATSVTVTNTQPIWWGRLGDQKDMGGYPYGAEFLTGATYTQVGNNYTITPTGHARKARVYVDGIPTQEIYDPIGGPWTLTQAGNVTAIKVYAEWAQKDPVVLASEQAPAEGGGPVAIAVGIARSASGGGGAF
jgi:hypothetical protein